MLPTPQTRTTPAFGSGHRAGKEFSFTTLKIVDDLLAVAQTFLPAFG